MCFAGHKSHDKLPVEEFWLSWTLTGVSLFEMTDGKQTKMSRWQTMLVKACISMLLTSAYVIL